MPSTITRRSVLTAAPAILAAGFVGSAAAASGLSIGAIEAELERIATQFAAGVPDAAADALAERETVLYAAGIAAPATSLADVRAKLRIASAWGRTYDREAARDDFSAEDMLASALRDLTALDSRRS